MAADRRLLGKAAVPATKINFVGGLPLDTEHGKMFATQNGGLGGNAYHFRRTTDDRAGNLYDSVEGCVRHRPCSTITPEDPPFLENEKSGKLCCRFWWFFESYGRVD